MFYTPQAVSEQAGPVSRSTFLADDAGDRAVAYGTQDFNDTGVRVSGPVPFNEGEDVDVFLPPFHCTYEIIDDVGHMSVTGGWWCKGAGNDLEWEYIEPVPPTVGRQVYLIIEQVAETPIVAIEVTTGLYPDALVLDEDPPYGVTEARVLIATIEAGEGKSLHQYRHGNFLLTHWQIDGNVTLWPETLVGTNPPPDPEPEP